LLAWTSASLARACSRLRPGSVFLPLVKAQPANGTSSTLPLAGKPAAPILLARRSTETGMASAPAAADIEGKTGKRVGASASSFGLVVVMVLDVKRR